MPSPRSTLSKSTSRCDLFSGFQDQVGAEEWCSFGIVWKHLGAALGMRIQSMRGRLDEDEYEKLRRDVESIKQLQSEFKK